jgi:hypothetical protein
MTQAGTVKIRADFTEEGIRRFLADAEVAQ